MTDPYATGVLDPDEHGRLVADIDHVARDANIQPHWIWTPLAEICSTAEIAWVRRFHFHKTEGISGLCYLGRDPDPEVEDRMAAMAGALTRNYVRARIMTVNGLIEAADNGAVPDMSCLLIPNFFVEKAAGGTQAPWRVSVLLDALLHRQTLGLQTVLYVSDMDAMGAEYGSALKRHVSAHYRVVEV